MKTLITSGGTTEKIDSVRGITNHATGSLGKYIAKFLKGHIEIAEIIGGIILILIGIKIVLNHLGYISF